MKKKYFLFFAGFLMALNFVCWGEVFALMGPQYLEVNFLNVGQGDSAFIETPGNNQILIDGGPDSTVLGKLGQNMPFWDKTLDLVILTHPEKDHMQGILYVLQKYKADYILWSGVTKTAPEYDAWLAVLEKQKKMGAKILIAEAGQEIKAGNVLIDTIYPLENMEGKEMKSSSNDSCVVSKLIYSKNSFLFTGDIDTTAEKKIVNSGEIISSDVLKVAHHGSKYSTSDLFLAGLGAKLAVIEVGKNSYGHPTDEVLNRLENFGIKVLRTDQSGDIKMVSDGKNIYIK
jgi:competence protein ComEC